jgi:hypothetical protein
MDFFGIDLSTFNGLVLFLLLLILGLVSFNAYSFMSAQDGLTFGSGFKVAILPQAGSTASGNNA